MKKIICFILISLFIPVICWSQVDNVNNTSKPFYSFYVKKKLNYRWSADLFTLAAFKSMRHDFWLAQYNFGLNYKINRFYEFSLGYGVAMYKYGNINWWTRHYPDIQPSSSGTANFSILSVRIKKNNKIGKILKLSNRLIIQHYFPKFEKYQTRIQYNVKLNYRRNKLPVSLKPFIQGAIYYYLNGIPIDYYDQDFNIVDTSVPNGFHRYRIRLGASLKPFGKNKKIILLTYIAFNREFNLSSLGHDINVPRPSKSGKKIFTSYQFNNYNILGIQVNYAF